MTEGAPFGVVTVTLFAEMFDSFLSASLLGKAIQSGRVVERHVDPRDYTADVHRSVDDAPYGGGAGMIMKPEPLSEAIACARSLAPEGSPAIMVTPQGRPFTQAVAAELAQGAGMVLVCGRYEGMDDRVRQRLVDREISIGDYVLSGGEVAAMVVIEAVTRLLPGVLGNAESPREESFAAGLLEYPQFTRPAEWQGLAVPDILRSGDHAKIRDWRRAQSLWRTRSCRPDLYAALSVTQDDERLMETYPPLGEWCD